MAGSISTLEAVAPEAAPRTRPLLRGFVHAKPAAGKLEAIEPPDRLRRVLGGGELDKGEASRTAAQPIGGHDDLDGLSDLGENRPHLIRRRVEAQIANEYLGADRFSPSCVPGP